MKPPIIEHIDFLRSAIVDTYTYELVGNALLVGKRFDGRTLMQPRKIHVEQLAIPGNVIVSLGNTIVLVSISSEIVLPTVEHPTEGIITFSVEISPMCSPNYEPGKASEVEQEITYAIEKIYKDSGIIDVESLCIVSRMHVWCLRVNVHILQNDGNLLDATNLAVFKALMSYRKPDTQLNADGMRLDLDTNYSSTLKIYHNPVYVTLGSSYNRQCIVVDANTVEERAVTTQISMYFNGFGDLFAIYKSGGTGISLNKISETIDIGKSVIQTYTR